MRPLSILSSVGGKFKTNVPSLLIDRPRERPSCSSQSARVFCKCSRQTLDK